MTVSLLAIQCPALPNLQVLLLKTTAYSVGTNLPVSYPLVAGDTVELMQKFNSNSLGIDLMGSYGGGAFAVARGLDISVPASGLNLNVAAGHAVINGTVEVSALTTVNVPDNTAIVWIWLIQNGTLTTATDTTAPSNACVCIGSCRTSGGSILSVDTSGVLYLKGGTLWRQTADTGAPGDVPPSVLQFTAITAGGTFWWDGAKYNQLGQSTSAITTALTAALDRIEQLENALGLLAFRITDGMGDDFAIVDDEIQQYVELVT